MFEAAGKTEIIAHRGYHHLDSERNTKTAFHRGLGMSHPIVECDLRQLGDGTIVINHNEAICEILLREMNLQDFRLASPDGITLEELLDLVSKHESYSVNFEVKEIGFETELMKIIETKLPPERYFYSSFRKKVLQKIREISPRTQVGLLLVENGSQSEIITVHQTLVSIPEEFSQYDFIMPRRELLQFPLVLQMYRDRIIPWGMEKDEVKRLIDGEFQYKAIITDYPL